MRRYIVLTLALLLATTLTACGGRQASGQTDGAEDTKAGSVAAPAEPEQAAPESERPFVENNGGHFVRVGGKVWFRYYGRDALDEPQLWGEFLDAYPSHGGASELCYYDEEGGAVVSAFSDDGFGPLWYGVGGFYLTRIVDESGRLAYFVPDGGEPTADLREGRVAGVSDNGRYAVIQSENPPAWSALYLYDGTAELASVTPGGDEYFEFCGLTDDGVLIYHCHSYETGADTLWQASPDGGRLLLGTLPTEGGEYAPYTLPELEQYLADGEDIYCVFGCYNGTGHFLYDAVCVRAQLGTEDSLRELERDETSEEEYAEMLPKLFLAGPGDAMLVDTLPDTIALSELDYGDLIWHDSPFSAFQLIRGFIPHGPYQNGGLIVQTAEIAGDAAYLMVAETYRSPEDDVGWRIAFTPYQMYYLRVPLREDSEAETLIGEAWVQAPPLDEVYGRFLGTWAMTAVEVEGDYTDELPDGLWGSLDFRENHRIVCSWGGGYENVFVDPYVVSIDGIADREYGLMAESETDGDGVFAYFEDGRLVVSVQTFPDDPGYGEGPIAWTGYFVRSYG